MRMIRGANFTRNLCQLPRSPQVAFPHSLVAAQLRLAVIIASPARMRSVPTRMRILLVQLGLALLLGTGEVGMWLSAVTPLRPS
jgi:hypothetical protein